MAKYSLIQPWGRGVKSAAEAQRAQGWLEISDWVFWRLCFSDR